MKKAIVLITELILIALAIFVADYWQDHTNIIPRSLIHLPQVDYSRADFWLIIKIFLGLHFLVFTLMQFTSGIWIFSDARRTISELFLMIAVYSVSALTIFLATTVNFDPDLMAGIGICSVTFFIMTHIVSAITHRTNPARVLVNITKHFFSRLFSIPGVLVLLLAITPPVLAYAFTINRDIANVITQVRININGVFNPSTEYNLVSATGDYRFSQPMLAQNPPHDFSILYILERSGRILSTAYPYDPSTPPKVILDLQDKLGYVEVENGALGFAFHPEFGNKDSKNSGYIYLYYTDFRDDKQVNRISRFDLTSGISRDIANSELALLVLNRETSGFHNGGSLEFGPDGYLYIALGEGVHLKETSQAKTLRQGILRIDVDMLGNDISHPVKEMPVNGLSQNYYIPNDNPFVARSDIRAEYWAIGLRNPFRISFDKETANLWAGDVGSTKWEEVNLIKKGGNYQFPYTEGFEEIPNKKPENIIGREEKPIYTYLHTAYDRAVIGGVVYRGKLFPDLTGKYVFADNYSSKLFAMPADGSPVSEAREIARAGQFAQRGVSSVTQLHNGDLLVTTLGRASGATGEVLLLSNKPVAENESTEKPLESMVITADEARELFVSNCARCHGISGQADGPDSQILGIQISDLTTKEFQSLRTDKHLQKVIAEGGNAVGLSPLMPPWEAVLAKEEIEALISYIRNLQKD